LEVQLNYWKQELSAAVGCELPFDRNRPDLPTNNGAVLPFQLPAELSIGLKKLAHDQNVTLFMVMLAAFQILLGRYTGSSDIVVGTDIANRNLLQVEGIVGFFVNELVLRSQIVASMTFLSFLQQVRETVLEAYACQDLPFEFLVNELAPVRSSNRHPLFQVKFTLQNAVHSNLDLGDLQLESFAAGAVSSKLDFTLFITETELCIRGVLIYATDLFEAITLRTFLQRYTGLLEEIVAEPGRPISDIPAITQDVGREALSPFQGSLDLLEV
jgi:non-ribosomal peptide synthetase component F